MATNFNRRFVVPAINTDPDAPDPLNAAVDGRNTPVDFKADFNSGFKFALASTRYSFVTSGTIRADRFGSGSPLQNGIMFTFRQADGFEAETIFEVYRNGDWGQFFDVEVFGNNRGMTATLDYRKTFGDVSILEHGTQIGFQIRDNLSNRFISFRAFHFGFRI